MVPSTAEDLRDIVELTVPAHLGLQLGGPATPTSTNTFEPRFQKNRARSYRSTDAYKQLRDANRIWAGQQAAIKPPKASLLLISL